ncbi:acyltransferase family protein [Adlercreutzia caecimuris]|uniref:acyltransferase family protein n=1 Tax=Adlercreutzia caecimuris TaxID=671266 RepID=UPI00258E03F0|nr:acyltransferase family protein [Adlercreutzia caecimuris]
MRDSNIELLRIVSMMLIILFHFSVHGPWPADGVLAADVAVGVLAFGGKLGVNCFVLITGYFMTRSSVRMASVARVVLETWFYSWGLLILFAVAQPELVTQARLEKAALPLVSGEYWFITNFVALMVVSPFLNLLFDRLSRRGKSRLAAIGFVTISVLPTLTTFNPLGSDLLWFFYLYLVGGWIRELMEGAEGGDTLAIALARDGGDGAAADRDAAWAKTAGASGALAWLDPARLTLRMGGRPMAVASILISWAAIAAICCAQAWFGFDRVNAQYPVWQYMIPTFLASTGMLVAFARLAMAPSRTVNNLAKCALGVYLIHDNPFVRAWLWPHFAAVYALGPAAIIGASLLAAVGVYAFGAAVDSLRIALLEKPLFRWLNSRFGDQLARADHWFATMGK